MQNYKFTVGRLECHDYATRLDELFDNAVGCEMKIIIEPDNKMENDAVMLMWRTELVGYVRSGEQRQQAARLLKMMNRPLPCRVVAADRSYKSLTIAVDTQIKTKDIEVSMMDELDGIDYQGELLRPDHETAKLRVIIESLADDIEDEHEWCDDMEDCMDYIAGNLWRDPSRETQNQVHLMEKFLRASSGSVGGYAEAADRMQYIISTATSDESRHRQAARLLDKAYGDEVRHLIGTMGTEAAEAETRKIPQMLSSMYDRRPDDYAGKLWYLRPPREKLCQLETLMAIRIALTMEREHTDMDEAKVLTDGAATLANLRNVFCTYDGATPKELALIYCALRDNVLLVNRYNYIGFIDLLVAKRLLPMMNETERKKRATAVGKYMKARMDHGNMRMGFGSDYHTWDGCPEKEDCTVIGNMLLQGLRAEK